MRRVDELIDRIADADVPVLITGESGVGKDVVAREIHAALGARREVFVKINCAALPGELLESELFGHERGAFTGAQRTKPGQFELADGGTLFLDEIGEMPVTMQAKLLQALQDGEFYRVGGQRKIKVDTRVIVATNVDLARAMERGTFREDLYYRLNVVEVAIPPLRERREDIPNLLSLFVHKYGKRYGRSLEELPAQIMERFLTYEFPGNIRELENLVRRLMVLRDPRYVLSELKERSGAGVRRRRRLPPYRRPRVAAGAAAPAGAVASRLLLPGRPQRGHGVALQFTEPAASAHHSAAARLPQRAGDRRIRPAARWPPGADRRLQDRPQGSRPQSGARRRARGHHHHAGTHRRQQARGGRAPRHQLQGHPLQDPRVRHRPPAPGRALRARAPRAARRWWCRRRPTPGTPNSATLRL